MSVEVCTDFTPDEIELVVARLEVADADLVFSSAHVKEPITRDELIKHVLDCDEVGKEYLEMQMNFLRSQSNGSLMRRIHEALASNISTGDEDSSRSER